MKRLWIASDSTRGREYTIDDSYGSPLDIAHKYGRAESGEIIHIWNDGNDTAFPDHKVYWDSQFRKYRLYNSAR